MSSTQILKSMVPPMLWNIGSRLKRRLMSSTTLLEYASGGWSTPLPGNASSDDFWAASIAQEQAVCEALIARVRAGEPLLHADSDESTKYATFGFVVALAARDRQKLAVLDYGGNLGDYFWLSRAFLPGVEFDYHCKELPRIAEAGRRITPDVTWHTDDETCFANHYDLVMFSSVVQCLPNWQEILHRAAQSTRTYLFLSDVATVTDAPSYVATHRAGGRMHLQIQIKRSEIIRAVEGSGLRLVREFALGAHPPIANAPEQPTCIGWLFERPRP